MSSERVQFAVAGRAMRQAVRRAHEARCSFEEHRVLEVVVMYTASYSRLVESIKLSTIAEEARLHPKNAGEALRRLAQLGIIGYSAGLGPGARLTVSLPPAPEKAAAEWGADGAPNGEPLGLHLNGASAAALSLASIQDREEEHEKAYEKSSLLDISSSTGTWLVEKIVERFNKCARTRFTAESWQARIAPRLREYPGLQADDYEAIIDAYFLRDEEDEWWDDPTPALIFGRSDLFEAALHRALGYHYLEVSDRLDRAWGF